MPFSSVNTMARPLEGIAAAGRLSLAAGPGAFGRHMSIRRPGGKNAVLPLPSGDGLLQELKRLVRTAGPT